MLWGCFAAADTGNLVGAHEVMKKEDYVDISKDKVMKPAATLA